MGAVPARCDAEIPIKNDLVELRRGKGWSQQDLAERLGVSRQTVNAIERNRYDPSLALAFKLAQVFDLSIEDVFHPEV